MTPMARLDVLPVILAGGSGTRLWPLSRALHPKQYLSLGRQGDACSSRPALRVAALASEQIAVGDPCVIANEEHRFTVVDQLHAGHRAAREQCPARAVRPQHRPGAHHGGACRPVEAAPTRSSS